MAAIIRRLLAFRKTPQFPDNRYCCTMSAQSDSETEPAAASIHRPSAKASAKRKPGRPADPCNDHFVFHTLDRKLLSCKHCKTYERKASRGVADRYEHLINCSEFLDSHPEQHAEMQAAIIESDLEAFLDYDFSNSTCQAIFSSGTVDPAASAQKPAAAAAATAGDLDEFWASLDL